MLKKADTLF